MKELKAQIKANFENNEFETAMELNKDLLAEYETLKGKRGVSALVSYYKNQAEKNSPVETPTEEVEAPISEPVEETPAEPTEVEEETPTTEDVTETPADVTEPTSDAKEFKFTLYKAVDPVTLQKAIDADCKEMKDFCVIKEYWEQKSDDEVISSTDMFVDRDPVTLQAKGFATWDDASLAAKNVGLVSYRKKGDFGLSEEGFPVGEVYCKVTVMYIGKALAKFMNRKNGIKEIKCISIA